MSSGVASLVPYIDCVFVYVDVNNSATFLGDSVSSCLRVLAHVPSLCDMRFISAEAVLPDPRTVDVVIKPRYELVLPSLKRS